ncbi:MAG: phosphoribosylanthranilate isomerase [Winogradskyella sp.]|nr:phosphoribosylanthranilate isomerase [Winogradskyella sp.]MBT8376857.1 phosphoribosylanthranilate isomerase [Bacteroidia bacterium]NNC46068.1 phosphoribosylanthranilate isomerase [Winogradskyella sp.]NNK39551.1 phosphoribosylanthranilate isomerase [Winogradskyella sp.]
MKLKVCGMKYPDNILEVAQLNPDYLGFIFYDQSARFVKEHLPLLPPTIKKVGVFVNARLESVIKHVKIHSLQAVQLHGNESPEFCFALNNESVEIIKVFSVDESFNFDILKNYETVCDYFLFDTKGKLPGGNGYSFNWEILKKYPSTKPYFLSGGIGIEEIKTLKEFKSNPASTYCYAIDVNSKFELKPGLKDIEQLKLIKELL